MKKKSFSILLAAALLLCLLPRMAPEAKAETIRDICSFCNTRAYHEITGFERYNDDGHWVIYKCPKYSLQGTTQGRYLTGGVPPVRFSM